MVFAKAQKKNVEQKETKRIKRKGEKHVEQPAA
jgi:hypothetical protein